MATGMWFVCVAGAIFLMISLRYGCVAAMKAPAGAAMFVLGDSSVDCGGNNPFNGLLHRNLSQFPCNGSDTTLLPQLLAKKMGLPYTTPFYSQTGSINGILRGLNFGSAEASILSPGSANYQSLNQQLRQAFETIQLLQLHLAQQMTNAVRSLYASNVRKIVCAGVLPLGCAPHVLLFGSESGTKKACLDEVNKVVSEYNRRLEENIVAIDGQLADARVVFCDVYGAVMEFINHPKRYGIEDVKNACCGMAGGGGCVSTETACQEASTHVWWDLYNPTPAINSLLAHSAWSVPSLCRPFSLKHLFSSP